MYLFKVETLVDVDTFHGYVENSIYDIGVKCQISLCIRAYGYDGCEVKYGRKGTVTSEEIVVGREAAKNLMLRLQMDSFFMQVVFTGKHDPYGRTSAECFFMNEASIADWARERGYTRETFKHGERLKRYPPTGRYVANGIPGELCTCKPGCPNPCKGGCGCVACGDAYSDFLSCE